VNLEPLLPSSAERTTLAPKLPAYLIAILAGALAAWWLHLPVETVGDRFPTMPTGLPAPRLPEFSFAMAREVLPSAFTIAFLAGIEALLSAVVADGMTGYRHRSGQELVGMGIANIASAAFGGLPATGAIARTATNVRAGAKTPVAGMAHAGFLLHDPKLVAFELSLAVLVGRFRVQQRLFGRKVVGQRLLAQAHGTGYLTHAERRDALPRHDLPCRVEDLPLHPGAADGDPRFRNLCH